MSLSPQTKRTISRIVPFGLIWLLLGWTFLFVEYAAIGRQNNYSPTAAIQMSSDIFAFASLVVLGVGLFIGVVEVVLLKKVFSNESFAIKILYKLLVYTLFLFMVILVAFPIAVSMQLHTHVFDPLIWQRFYDYLTSLGNVSTSVQMAVSLLISLFYAEISENIGQKILFNFFTGKYHKPLEEKRVFMFLDMKSSTAIAEQLGHIMYFELLKKYYDDLSDAILKNHGEVYQYIGDEIVISWPFEKGIKNNHCIHCFLAMKADLKKKSSWYLKKFGVTPTFKAGLHCGKVTTGEIGALKKEIIFTGDVLNTTSRIQGLCNTYHVDIIISKELVNELAPDTKFMFYPIGTQELRGRAKAMELFTLKSS
ncbi:adenylate/guanylate cyclase domain-containing protein [Fulvivirga sp. 29W222]|uniref:Adenylate/guanylate cyclase domain-containing protein n=1 Tax=Fulvivirga marina TaxID=2494733 RepID=A0A937KBL0_9BACT|nr:adenylate/guanylate cyclase domain-containing protein [Fulvivirga marina]MBL6447061.1 adenylate/guanylate cyclase domain-containing protein [Fulvivirga marina]